MSDATKHTPGPWEACDSELWGLAGDSVVVSSLDAEGFPIEVAEVCGQQTAGERDANVRLIEAAPDLLAACEQGKAIADQMLATLGNDRNAKAAFAAAVFRLATLLKNATKLAKS